MQGGRSEAPTESAGGGEKEREEVKSQNNLPRAKTDWETPPELMEALQRDFGGFDLDPCATYENRKAAAWFGRESWHCASEDGLEEPWFGKAFVNPPYGRDIWRWVEKCHYEVTRGTAELVVALLPVSPDTRWWQTWVSQATEARFLKGRITFVGAAGPAPFASAIVVWRRGMLGWHRVSYWDWKTL